MFVVCPILKNFEVYEITYACTHFVILFVYCTNDYILTQVRIMKLYTTHNSCIRSLAFKFIFNPLHHARINERYDAAKEVCAGWLGTNTKSASLTKISVLP